MLAERPFVDTPAGPGGATGGAAAHAAEVWGLPSPTLLRAGMTATFSCGDVVVRVARPTAPAEAGLELARTLSRLGLRVARPARPDVVRHGQWSVTAWERLVPAGAPVDWAAVGAMVAAVHDLSPSDLPAEYPVPLARHLPWWDFDRLLAEAEGTIDVEARAGLEGAVRAHRWCLHAAALVVCHGDVHPGNVMTTATAETVLLDWDLLCRAPRGWDHAGLLQAERWRAWGAPYPAFADGYGTSLAEDAVTVALAELRLVAATLMRLRAARADRAAAPEAQLRLAYWRDGPTAPRWTPA